MALRNKRLASFANRSHRKGKNTRSRFHERSWIVRAEDASFRWEEQWYPIAYVEDLDVGRPTKTTLLGRDMVLWKDGSDRWRCFEDLCPHRLAPLSEGRLEDGKLQCTYHGWLFDGEGRCTRIPQLPKEDGMKNERIMSNQRACSRVYPCKVAQGTVFVFASPDHELSDITPLPLVPGLDEEDYSGVRAIRELPYGWDTLIENVADPSHVPFAHHGIQGNRAKAVPINMQVESGVGPNGMSTTWEVRAPGAKTPRAVAQLCFQAPARLTYTTDIKVGKLAGKKFLLHAYCIPVAPGRSRLMFRAGSNVGGLFSLLLKITPRWYDHIERNDVLSGDLVLLHKQERLLRQGGDPGGGDWKSRFYTPAAADLMVNLFREWIDRFGQPAWVPGTDPALPPELLDRRQLLDLQSQHTDHCASCRAAQKRFQSITVLLAAIGLVLLGSTSLYVGNTKVVKSLLLAGLGACAAAFAAWRAERHIFVFRDYVHAFR